MNARTAVLSLLAIKPLTATELGGRLPYSRHTLYKAVSELERSGLVERARSGRSVVLSLSRGHEAWAVGRLVRAAVGHGIDPEELLRDGTRRLVAALDRPMTLGDLRKTTGLSYDILHRALDMLVASGLIVRTKGRPLTVQRAEDHPVLALLDELRGQALDHGVRLVSATADVAISMLPPTALEGRLHSAIDGPMYVSGTGLLTKGTDRLEVLMAGPDPTSPEDLFLRLLGTPEGVEDLCPQLLRSGKLDLARLGELAVERGQVKQLGAYLDVLKGLGLDVPEDVLRRLEGHVRGRRVPFPGWEEALPDKERDRDIERRWRVEFRLDVPAIMHTVRVL
jgi:DNA-binding MarR family transcriptional regulator